MDVKSEGAALWKFALVPGELWMCYWVGITPPHQSLPPPHKQFLEKSNIIKPSLFIFQ